MPISAFAAALACMFARIAESGIASMSPAPNIGVGMRKMMLEFPPWPLSGFPAGRKSGWEILHPGASVRPVMTKRLCTSPSLEPLGFRLKRASRTGPFGAMNQGTTFLAPLSVATAIKGFCAGLDPPGAGCEWQDRHWLELKRGPSPLLLPPCHDFDFREPGEPVLEKRGFVCGKVIQRTAGAWRTSPHSWIDRPFCRSSQCANAGYDQDCGNESNQNIYRSLPPSFHDPILSLLEIHALGLRRLWSGFVLWADYTLVSLIGVPTFSRELT